MRPGKPNLKFGTSDDEVFVKKAFDRQQVLSLVFESLSSGLLVTGLDGRVLEMNAKFTSMWRIEGEVAETDDCEFLWKHIVALLDDSDSLVNALENTNNSREKFADKLRLSNGLVFECYSAPLIENQAVLGRMWSFRDISERCQIEEYLKRSKEQAEAASKTKSEFLANISHEIRTPLNGVMGMLHLLQMTPMDQEQSEYLDMAAKSSKRLSNLLNDILDLSRVEAGVLQVAQRTFDRDDLISSVKEMFDIEASKKNVSFTVTIDKALPQKLVGDDTRLRQVLINLLGNAFRFTECGSVTLDATYLPSEVAGKSRVLFTVADTGLGIDDSMVGVIFQSFRQVDSSITRRYQGAGLGLAIVKRLVGLMQGSISLDTELGAGSTFYVSIPIRSSEECIEKDALNANKQNHDKKRNVLVVEDDFINRMYLMRFLEMKEYCATSAENGGKALQALRHEDFDCVLMDVQMPVMDGLETTTLIRNSPDFKHCRNIPIIALTAHALKGDREKFLATGMSGYIAKPVDFQELMDVMDSLCASVDLDRAGDKAR